MIKPTEQVATALSLGEPASNSRSTLSVRTQKRPSLSLDFLESRLQGYRGMLIERLDFEMGRGGCRLLGNSSGDQKLGLGHGGVPLRGPIIQMVESDREAHARSPEPSLDDHPVPDGGLHGPAVSADRGRKAWPFRSSRWSRRRLSCATTRKANACSPPPRRPSAQRPTARLRTRHDGRRRRTSRDWVSTSLI